MSRKFLAAPFLVWMLGGTLIPLCLIMYYGFTDREGQFTLRNITAIAEPVHAEALALALLLALASTIICFLIAAPLALILKDSRLGKAGFMVFIFILPMWMNFLLRTMAWQVILEKEGLFDTALSFIGLSMPQIINTPAAVVLGMVYDFLPYMIIQIHTSISKLDRNLLVASYDLGATPWKTFLKVTLPLSVPGIISGITLVFLPAVSSFVIPKLLGGGNYVLIGNLIETYFLVAGDWNFGSAVSLIMALIIIASMYVTKKLDRSTVEE